VPSWDVVVIGGGAAGLFCAATAGRRGRSVLVLDHSSKLGRKILISGGGRCNFTNRQVSADNFLSGNPHFCRSALARYAPADFIALVERHGIVYHERDHGQLFCTGSAKEILAMLLAECTAAGVTVQAGCRVGAVERRAEGFNLATSAGPVVGQRLVLATGGLSLPTIGATDFGHRLARQFGLAVRPTAPALVPFTLDPGLGLSALSGIAVDARITCGTAAFRENVLFTHSGISGPAVLQISSYWNPGEDIAVDLLPGIDAAAYLEQARSAGSQSLVSTHLSEMLPRRLVQARLADFADRPAARLARRDLEALRSAFHAWTLTPTGTEGYRKAEVTRGGIDTHALSSQTMEARAVPGLFCIGEVVDVTGWLGGYNFHWAWASGNAAGLAV
jgi:predicted Rossmann fold flavoprotein